MTTPSDKTQLRARLRAARVARSPAELARSGAALAAHALELPELVQATTVACYASVGAEPPTATLRAGLRARGVRVLLPIVRDDLDLDWAVDGTEELTRTGRALLEPGGARLGREAIEQAEVLFVPALAVGADGTRLGRGGGCYDRALPRRRRGALVVAVVFDEEVLVTVPTQPHDESVDAALRPSGLTRFSHPASEDAPAR